EITRRSGKTDTLFLLGVDARYKAPESAITAIKALEMTGAAFTVLYDEKPTGQQLEFLIGMTEETKNQMTDCAEQINAFKRVIVYDPSDAVLLKRVYGENGVELNVEVKTFTEFLYENLERIVPESEDRKAVYQDPFQLSRDLDEIQGPRSLVRRFRRLGEMLNNGKNTIWAGNILMAEWMPDVIKKVASNRIEDAVRVNAEEIITASVSEYVSLRSVDQNAVRILSIEDLIVG
ncbi:MAG: (Fe-S)-binding protein, partial [Clostridia bacterium]|nr:(Fe-S)-binding protein [Clostridia bacterium]